MESQFNEFDLILVSEEYGPDICWVPKIFLGWANKELRVCYLNDYDEYHLNEKNFIKEIIPFNRSLAFKKYIDNRPKVIPKKDDIVWVTNCDYMFNAPLGRKNWVVRKFSSTDHNKFVMTDGSRWDFCIPYYDVYFENMDITRILTIDINNKITYYETFHEDNIQNY